ncbi:MAG: helix-turn-helix domain-containing protein, partial [Actinobacteria bacterium]|nr:helix-turn-helix domain-containing protein [Actinomycetota bacterium]
MKTVQSIDRAFSLLEEITRKPAGISDLARSVDLPTSTVARLLYTLEDLGAIVRTADDTTYQIGPA